MKVAVIGTGHVGLVTCVSMARIGHHVVGIDSDWDRIVSLQNGVPPFYEPGLEEALTEELGSGRLSFTPNMAEALPGAEVVFICVGTPAGEQGEADLLAVESAARLVAQHADDGTVVVAKSTVPAGTADRIRLTLARENPGGRFEPVANPEFSKEGSGLRDAIEPDRILVGAESERAFDVMRQLYRPLTELGYPLLETDIRTAELAKHACNAFLALKISYVNGLARVCERLGANVADVADVMGSDPRIGRAFLDAGLGYGGYCFPKDVSAFLRLTRRVGYEFRLLEETARINDEAVQAVLEKIEDGVWNVQGKRIALLGLAYKPGTDDVRFAPALTLARSLIARGATVTGYDPRAGSNATIEVPDLEVASDPYQAATGAHCLVIATEWDEFRSLDLSRLKTVMAYPVIVDGRNVFDRGAMRKEGFTYYPTGAPAVLQNLSGAENNWARSGGDGRPTQAGVSGSLRRPGSRPENATAEVPAARN